MTSSPPLERKQLDDRLSPILVKELRQGMRARAFVISFLLLQVFLVMLVLANLAAAGNRNALNGQSSYFWVIVGFALLLLMPMRGLNAISQEVRRNTLETILLTRMTAWRIVFGKWSALFAQSLLFVSSVLPYVVLRYFIGGDDVVSDFEWLFFLLWLSGMLIAASIAASAIVNMVVRVIVVLVMLWLFGVADAEFIETGTRHPGFWDELGLLTLGAIFIPALLFEVTASTIAPVAENHAARRRLLALLFFICGLAWVETMERLEPTNLLLAVAALIGVCYFELSEKPQLIPRLVEPFNRFGWPGRIVGLFFLPGWPSALLFTLVVLPLSFFVVYWISLQYKNNLFLIDYYNGLGLPLYICACLGSVLVPIFICHLLWRKMKQVFLMVILYNLALWGVASLIKGFAELTNLSIDMVLWFIPGIPTLSTSMYPSHSRSGHGDQVLLLIGNSLTLAILLLILFIASRTYFQGLFTLFRVAKQNPPPTS